MTPKINVLAISPRRSVYLAQYCRFWNHDFFDLFGSQDEFLVILGHEIDLCQRPYNVNGKSQIHWYHNIILAEAESNPAKQSARWCSHAKSMAIASVAPCFLKDFYCKWGWKFKMKTFGRVPTLQNMDMGYFGGLESKSDIRLTYRAFYAELEIYLAYTAILSGLDVTIGFSALQWP